MHERRIVSFDPVWDDTLTWYERAVAKMRSRPLTDPTSWDYQAAIHGTASNANVAAWRTCEHGGWFFFPWHRAYLAAFEDIVRAAVTSLGGPEEWALPYWDYELDGFDSLPPAFRAPKNSSGQPNKLFVTERWSYVNDGVGLRRMLAALDPAAADEGLSSTRGMNERTFSGGGADMSFPFGFGGGQTPSSHQANSYSHIESQLHGTVHVLVGGPEGWMRNPDTAARDPIFWLHHANIDRLWSKWAAQAGRTNPTQAAWLTQGWTFFEPAGTSKQWTPAAVQDTADQLDYRYDTDGPVQPPIDVDAAMVDDVAGAGGSRRDLQPVGLVDGTVRLSGHAAAATVELDDASIAALTPAAGLDAPTPRSFLELADIDVPDEPGILYGVYLAGGSDTEAAQLVGLAPFFAARPDAPQRDQHEHRLRYVFDATEALQRLAVGADSIGSVRVLFRPLGPAQLASALDGLDGAPEPPMPEVAIGRVALLMG
jgi:tyrosinase